MHIGDCIRQGERQFLHSGAASLSDVITRNGNRVPLWNVLGAIRKNIGDDPHRRPWWIHICSTRDVFLQQIVLNRAADFAGWHATLLCNELVHQQQNCRRRVDGHRRRDLVERQVSKQRAHVVERVNGYAHLAHLTSSPRVVAVVSHLGGQVEGTRQPGLSGFEQKLESLVGVGSTAKTCVLTHRPESVTVHRRINTPGVRRFAWGPKTSSQIAALSVGHRSTVIQRLHHDARIRAFTGWRVDHAEPRLRAPHVLTPCSAVPVAPV